jgi:hypothetical protein
VFVRKTTPSPLPPPAPGGPSSGWGTRQWGISHPLCRLIIFHPCPRPCPLPIGNILSLSCSPPSPPPLHGRQTTAEGFSYRPIIQFVFWRLFLWTLVTLQSCSCRVPRIWCLLCRVPFFGWLYCRGLPLVGCIAGCLSLVACIAGRFSLDGCIAGRL